MTVKILWMCILSAVLTVFQRQSMNVCAATLCSPPCLLVSNTTDILAVDYKTSAVNSVVSGLTRAVALDVHFSLGYIFWSDETERNIKRFRIDLASTTTIITGIGVCDGLAVDWRTSQLYWTDTMHDTISVSDLDGNNQSLLIYSDLDKPSAIALDLDSRLMIWSDAGTHPKIEKASLSGNQRVAIVTTYLFYPNGIELDRGNKRIFWVDAGYDRVESINYNGSNRKILFQLAGLHPYGVVLIAPFLFFTDWKTQLEVHKLEATTGKVLRSYSINGGQPMGIVAYDSARQPSASSPCAVNNGGCSHFCVTKTSSHECVCKTGLAVKQDGKTCEDRVRKFILFADADDNSANYISLDVNYFLTQTFFHHLENQHLTALDFDPSVLVRRSPWSNFQRFFKRNIQSPDGLDHVGRNIYWTDTGTNRIEVGRLDGTSRKLLIKDGLDKPRSIVLLERNGMMYWTDWGASPKIEQAEMDGSARRTIVTGNLGWPNGLTIDQATNRLFWADAKLNTIEASDLSGKNRQLIMSSIGNIHPFGLAVYQDMLYWTDWNTKSITRFNLTSRKQETIVNGLQKPMDIHVFDPSLIFSGPHNCSQNNGFCSDFCLLKPGGYQCACPTGIALKSDGKNCDYGTFYKTSSKKFMIVAEGYVGKIYKVPLEVPETPCFPLGINTKISRPVAVDYDPVEGKVYWTDVKLKLVARSFPNGSSVEVIAYNVITPAGLAVDYVGRNIYWTDERTNRIEVARLDGSSRKSLITSSIEKPRAILLDIGERKMYWGGRGVSLKIEQANMDGSARTILVSSGLQWVNSLAMDYQNRLLYWCDAYLDKIERVDLQGNNRMVILDLSLDSMHPFGLALFGDALYWSDWKSESVHKYNMSTSLNEVVVRGMGNPMELHIYDQSKDFVAVTCPALLTPPNGIRQGCTGTTTEYYNTVCLFFCNAGFNAVGSPSRRCLENRTWSGQDFLCQAVTCPALVAPPNGIRQGCTGTTTEYYNTVCLFSCNAGFDAVGSLSRKCLENGNWSGQDFLCQETSSSGKEVILEHTSSLAIAVGSSIAVFAFLAATISVAILCMRKRGFLIRTWRRVIGRENVGENNQGYEERDGNENNVQRANVGFQNQHNQGRWQLYIREENVGENNQGYDDRDGNQNNLAGRVELQLANHGIRRSPAESSQIDAASSDNGATAGSSASAAPDERGSGENPVTEKHCFCISHHVGVDWKKVLRKLSMAEMTIRNLDEDYKHCEVAEKCYQGLLKWKESFGPQGATIKKLCDALQNVGCSEALEALRSMSHQSDC